MSWLELAARAWRVLWVRFAPQHMCPDCGDALECTKGAREYHPRWYWRHGPWLAWSAVTVVGRVAVPHHAWAWFLVQMAGCYPLLWRPMYRTKTYACTDCGWPHPPAVSVYSESQEERNAQLGIKSGQTYLATTMTSPYWNKVFRKIHGEQLGQFSYEQSLANQLQKVESLLDMRNVQNAAPPGLGYLSSLQNDQRPLPGLSGLQSMSSLYLFTDPIPIQNWSPDAP